MSHPRNQAVYHLLLHTHWDREWYFPETRFRFHLVRFMDRLIGLLERNSDFGPFLLDGQAVLLQDYLELKPQRASHLKRLIEEGRIEIGPWYVQADGFLVHGESIVRNLLVGRRIASAFGRPMAVGYLPDAFGHPSQMPQILRGFGIATAVVWRGVDIRQTSRWAEFVWKGPDGSSVLAWHLPKRGYTTVFSEEETRTFQTWLDEEENRSLSGHRLLFLGGDHLFPDPEAPKRLRKWGKRVQLAIAEGGLEAALSAIGSDLEGKEVPSLTGELRSGLDYAPLLQGVTSARIPLKIAYHRIECLLLRHLEPIAALARLTGIPLDPWSLQKAWEKLLKLQPHDTLCGCVSDPAAREIAVRLEQAEAWGEEVREAFLHTLNPSGPGLTLINPTLVRQAGFIEGRLFLADEAVGEGGFRLVDVDGQEVPYQIIRRRRTGRVVRSDRAFPRFLAGEEVVLVIHKALPPLSVTGLRVLSGAPCPLPTTDLVVSGHALENRFLRVLVHPNGTLTVTDRETGHVYRGLLLFESVGDRGDLYTFSRTPGQRRILSRTFPVRISLVEIGPFRGAIRIRVRMKVPRGRESQRSGFGLIKLFTTVRLDANSRLLRFETEVDNLAEDHRLCVLFPTDCLTDASWASSAFHVVRRGLAEDVTDEWIERPAGTHPMAGFVTIRDANRAVSLLTRGLAEYELRNDRRRTLALTLLRCVRFLSKEGLPERPAPAGPIIETPEAQCPGNHRFHYALYFHPQPVDSDWHSVYQAYDAYAVDPVLSDTITVDIPSFLTIDPPCVHVVAFKPSEDGENVILRLVNPSDAERFIHILFHRPIRHVTACRLDETPLHRLQFRDGVLPLRLRAWEITTLRLHPF